MNNLLTVREIAVEYRVSTKTIHRWVAKGLPVLQQKKGSKVMVRREEMERWLGKGGKP